MLSNHQIGDDYPVVYAVEHSEDTIYYFMHLGYLGGLSYIPDIPTIEEDTKFTYIALGVYYNLGTSLENVLFNMPGIPQSFINEVQELSDTQRYTDQKMDVNGDFYTGAVVEDIFLDPQTGIKYNIIHFSVIGETLEKTIEVYNESIDCFVQDETLIAVKSNGRNPEYLQRMINIHYGK